MSRFVIFTFHSIVACEKILLKSLKYARKANMRQIKKKKKCPSNLFLLLKNEIFHYHSMKHIY